MEHWSLIYKTQHYQKIYVLGAGAVGCYFGGMLARANHDVTFIARPERVDALNASGLEMDCKAFHDTEEDGLHLRLVLLQVQQLLILTIDQPLFTMARQLTIHNNRTQLIAQKMACTILRRKPVLVDGKE